MNKAKPYLIDKAIIWRAWLAVKANRGSAGADGVTIEAFEHNLARNLYKIWNRLSSGCYMPPPVKRVEIFLSQAGTLVHWGSPLSAIGWRRWQSR